jgi:hypothetical protein
MFALLIYRNKQCKIIDGTKYLKFALQELASKEVYTLVKECQKSHSLT